MHLITKLYRAFGEPALTICAIALSIYALLNSRRQTQLAETGQQPDFDCSFEYVIDANGNRVEERLILSNVGFRAQQIRCKCYSYLECEHMVGVRSHKFLYPIMYFDSTAIAGTKTGKLCTFLGYQNRKEEHRLYVEAVAYGQQHQGDFILVRLRHFIEASYTDMDGRRHTKYFSCDDIGGIRDVDSSVTDLWNGWIRERGQLPEPKDVTLDALLVYESTSAPAP